MVECWTEVIRWVYWIIWSLVFFCVCTDHSPFTSQVLGFDPQGYLLSLSRWCNFRRISTEMHPLNPACWRPFINENLQGKSRKDWNAFVLLADRQLSISISYLDILIYWLLPTISSWISAFFARCIYFTYIIIVCFCQQINNMSLYVCPSLYMLWNVYAHCRDHFCCRLVNIRHILIFSLICTLPSNTSFWPVSNSYFSK